MTIDSQRALEALRRKGAASWPDAATPADHVTKSQAKEWLKRLVSEGVLTKTGRPARYDPGVGPSQESLFGSSS
jgi:DNA-binding IclR family transcriptional regulator